MSFKVYVHNNTVNGSTGCSLNFKQREPFFGISQKILRGIKKWRYYNGKCAKKIDWFFSYARYAQKLINKLLRIC